MLNTGIYYESWAAKWWGSTIGLENMPSNSGAVYLAFCHPFPSGVLGGLEFMCDITVLKEAIQKAKSRGNTIMLSVGGGLYKFAAVAPHANYCKVVEFAQSLGCDGIDIDWEPDVESLGRVPHEQFGPIIAEFRKTGWAGMKLSCAAAPNGAAEPTNLWRGLNRSGLITHGHMLDWVNIMAYDSGKSYNVFEAFDTFRSIYKGPLYLGVELGPQGWGDALTTEQDVLDYHAHISVDPKAGFFVWAYHKEKGISPSVERIIAIAESASIDQQIANLAQSILDLLKQK